MGKQNKPVAFYLFAAIWVIGWFAVMVLFSGPGAWTFEGVSEDGTRNDIPVIVPIGLVAILIGLLSMGVKTKVMDDGAIPE